MSNMFKNVFICISSVYFHALFFIAKVTFIKGKKVIILPVTHN